MLGDKIKTERMKIGISQAKLGEMLSVTQQAVGKWEKNIAEPDSNVLNELATLFNVSTDYLLSREEIKNPRDLQLDGAYFHLLKRVKDEGIPPEDIEKIIDFYKKMKK